MRIQMIDDSDIPVGIDIQQIATRVSSDGKTRFVDAKIVLTEYESNGQAVEPVTLILNHANRKRLIRALKAL